MSRILVTGGTGFVGGEVLRQLQERGTAPLLMVRDPRRAPGPGVTVQGDLAGQLPPPAAFENVETIIHLAARVHVMRDTAADPLAEFRRINCEGTLQLARRAREGGTRRFVFLSTIKVNGEETTARPFTSSDPPAPQDAYGLSKWEAEQGLAELSSATGMEVVVIRAPLVHGPGAGGNLRQLLALIQRRLPLPLASVRNRRRMVGVCNLADLLILAAEHPAAAGRTFLVGDAEACSTPELLRSLASGLGVVPRLLPCSPGILLALGRLTGRHAEIKRLMGSLDFDISDTTMRLGWRPRLSAEEGLVAMARAWKAAQ